MGEPALRQPTPFTATVLLDGPDQSVTYAPSRVKWLLPGKVLQSLIFVNMEVPVTMWATPTTAHVHTVIREVTVRLRLMNVNQHHA